MTIIGQPFSPTDFYVLPVYQHVTRHGLLGPAAASQPLPGLFQATAGSLLRLCRSTAGPPLVHRRALTESRSSLPPPEEHVNWMIYSELPKSSVPFSPTQNPQLPLLHHFTVLLKKRREPAKMDSLRNKSGQQDLLRLGSRIYLIGIGIFHFGRSVRILHGAFLLGLTRRNRNRIALFSVLKLIVRVTSINGNLSKLGAT